MNAADLRKLDFEEIQARIKQFRDDLFNLQVKKATGQLENTSSLGTARRNLARALTVQAQKGRER